MIPLIIVVIGIITSYVYYRSTDSESIFEERLKIIITFSINLICIMFAMGLYAGMIIYG